MTHANAAQLDWQMWFAALGSYDRGNAWLLVLAHRLLESKESVANVAPLFDESIDALPLPAHRIRLTRRRYRFTRDWSSTDYWQHDGEPSDYLRRAGGSGELDMPTIEKLVKVLRTESDTEGGGPDRVPPMPLSRTVTQLCIVSPWIVLLALLLVYVRLQPAPSGHLRPTVATAPVTKQKKNK